MLSSDTYGMDDDITVTFNLSNSGPCEGTEIVQLYVRDLVGSVTRPVKELKAFRRVTLGSGETQAVSFNLPVRDLAFWGMDMTYGVEPGAFTLWVGPDSATGLSADFTVVKR